MMKNASAYKIKATQDLGAKILLFENRNDANIEAKRKEQDGYFFIHPFTQAMK